MIIAAAFLFAASAMAVDFHKPTRPNETAALAKAQTEITAANKALTDWQEAQIRRSKLIGVDQDQERAKADAQIASLRNDLLKHGAEAVEAVKTAYGIRPDKPHGSIVVPGNYARSNASWAPQFALPVQSKILTGADGKAHVEKGSLTARGYTWANGAVEIYPAALISPAFLAAVLVHETDHFDQYTTPGRGDHMGPWMRETQAYGLILNDRNAATLGLTSAELDIAKRDCKAGLEQIRMATGNPSEARSPDSPEAIKAGGHDAFLGAVVADVTPMPFHDPRNEAWDLARRICSNPSGAKQVEVDSLMDALIAFCRQDSCSLAPDPSCPGLLQSAMFQEARRGHRIALDLLESQGPVEWIPRPQMTASTIGHSRPAVVEDDYSNAPSEAWELATKACNGQAVSQLELDAMLKRLSVCRKKRGYAVPISAGCAEDLFKAMDGAAASDQKLSAAWFNYKGAGPSGRGVDPGDDGRDHDRNRGSDNGGDSGGHGVPDHKWNPIFHPN